MIAMSAVVAIARFFADDSVPLWIDKFISTSSFMTSRTTVPALSSLDFIPYLQAGEIPADLAGKVGVYAIFDAAKALQYVGYSRDIYLSLKQHFVRCPHACHWLKVQTVERPSRTLLEEIRQAWIAASATTPPGNQTEANVWTQPIDAKLTMTDAEKAAYDGLDELGQIKLLKQIARRVEAEIQQQATQRGAVMDFRFNPKMKEAGLLDLK